MSVERQPLLSVIIPVYNKEPHVARSITSVLNQTFHDFELLIVCDPSIDSSNAEVAKFSDSRIRLFHRSEPGPGGYAARNVGAAHARADWIAFLDADDEWDINHLETLASLIKNYPASGIVGTSWQVIEQHKAASTNAYTLFQKGREEVVIEFEDYLSSSAAGRAPFWTSSLAVRRDILVSVGGFPEGKCRRGGDVDTWLRVLAVARQGAWSSAITAVYHRDSVNMVTRTEAFTADWEMKTIQSFINLEADPKTRKALKKYLNTRVINRYVQATVETGNREKSLAKYVFLDELTPKQYLVVVLSNLPLFILRTIVKTKLWLTTRLSKR